MIDFLYQENYFFGGMRMNSNNNSGSLINPIFFNDEHLQDNTVNSNEEQELIIPVNFVKNNNLINPIYFINKKTELINSINSDEKKNSNFKSNQTPTSVSFSKSSLQEKHEPKAKKHSNSVEQNNLTNTNKKSSIYDKESLLFQRFKTYNDGAILNLPYDDLGNVNRLLSVFGDIVRFNNTKKYWLLWDSKKWNPCTTEDVKLLCLKTMEVYQSISNKYPNTHPCKSHSKKACNNTPIDSMLEMLKVNCLADNDVFDNFPMLLNVNNGTINLMTGELSQHNKNLMLTQIVNVDYEPFILNYNSAFINFINSICNGDVNLHKYLQKVFGYGITGETKEQVLFILQGEGSNGKTTLLQAIADVINNYVKYIPINTLLQASNIQNSGKATPELAQADKARMLFASEVNANDFFNEAKIKQLTGESVISVRNLYQTNFVFKPKFKIIIDTNHLPKIKGSDFAI